MERDYNSIMSLMPRNSECSCAFADSPGSCAFCIQHDLEEKLYQKSKYEDIGRLLVEYARHNGGIKELELCIKDLSDSTSKGDMLYKEITKLTLDILASELR